MITNGTSRPINKGQDTKDPSMTTESVEEGSLTAYLRHIKQTLCVPAAEYVPAMGDAMLMLDRAIQMSYQTDPTWIRPAAKAFMGNA